MTSIKVGKTEYTLKELTYLNTVGQEIKIGSRDWFKQLLQISIVKPEPTDELLNDLTFQEGNELMAKINEINGLDFRNPLKKEKLN